MLSPFWRREPLTHVDQTMLSLLNEAHAKAALRNNISSFTVANAAAGSHNYVQAIAAGLMTLGGTHAPLADTMGFLEEKDCVAHVPEILAAGLRIPGWGNSFIRGEPDPDWAKLHLYLQPHFPQINQITEALHGLGKKIFPNPSTYTAAVAIFLRVPPKLSPYLFVQARLEAWSQLTLPYLR